MTIFAWVGLMFVGAVAVLLSVALVMFCRERMEYQRSITAHKDGELAIRRMAERMIQDSYWFSDSHEAYRAVFLIASRLSSRGSYDISNVRDEWRREMSSK